MDPDHVTYPCNSLALWLAQGHTQDGISLPSLMEHLNGNGILNDNPSALDSNPFSSWHSRLLPQPPDTFGTSFVPLADMAIQPEAPALEFWTSTLSPSLQTHGGSESSDKPPNIPFADCVLPSQSPGGKDISIVSRAHHEDIVPQSTLVESSTSWMAPRSAAGGVSGKCGTLHP